MKKIDINLDCIYLGYQYSKPIDDFPDKMPNSATYIIGVEWTWSPWHSRIDSYYISRNRSNSHWFFWHSYVDDNDFSYPTINTIVAICPKINNDIKLAAINLLKVYWENESELSGLDKAYWYRDYGLLSDKEVDPIAENTLKNI